MVWMCVCAQCMISGLISGELAAMRYNWYCRISYLSSSFKRFIVERLLTNTNHRTTHIKMTSAGDLMCYALAFLVNSAPAKQGIPHAMEELVNTNDTLSLHVTEVSCTASEAHKTEGLASSANNTQYWLMMRFNRRIAHNKRYNTLKSLLAAAYPELQLQPLDNRCIAFKTSQLDAWKVYMAAQTNSALPQTTESSQQVIPKQVAKPLINASRLVLPQPQSQPQAVMPAKTTKTTNKATKPSTTTTASGDGEDQWSGFVVSATICLQYGRDMGDYKLYPIDIETTAHRVDAALSAHIGILDCCIVAVDKGSSKQLHVFLKHNSPTKTNWLQLGAELKKTTAINDDVWQCAIFGTGITESSFNEEWDSRLVLSTSGKRIDWPGISLFIAPPHLPLDAFQHDASASDRKRLKEALQVARTTASALNDNTVDPDSEQQQFKTTIKESAALIKRQANELELLRKENLEYKRAKQNTDFAAL